MSCTPGAISVDFKTLKSAPTRSGWTSQRGRAHGAHDLLVGMMREHEEFEVETDQAGEPPMPFWSETVRRVAVE